ncbi:MAG: hypothetical protein AAFX03_04355 [Pseudomonadota bacterium]
MIAAGAAFLLSVGLCRLVLSVGPLDRPDGGRKRQARAVPTAGGLGFAPAALIGWAILAASTPSLLASVEAWSIIILLAGAVIIGVLDDMERLSTRTKFACLAVLAFAAAAASLAARQIPLPGLGDVRAPWLVMAAGSALWVFVVINAVNFVDGANGLAMGALAVMSLCLAAAAPNAAAAPVLIVLAAALAGFLVWNLPGRLYAGDTGAYAAGAAYAGAGLWLVADGALSVWTPAAAAAPILIDVLLTLAWRARAGRNLLEPHRDHAYQLCIRAGWSHERTAAAWWGLAAVAGAIAALASRAGPDAAFWGFWAVIGAGSALWVWQRRTFAPLAAG